MTERAAVKTRPEPAVKRVTPPAAAVRQPGLPGNLEMQRWLRGEGAGTGPGSRIAPPDLPGGEPIPAGLRQAAEANLAMPLDDVRLHRGPDAARLAERNQAAAFTLGRHIVMHPALYPPSAPQSMALLGHELVHVAQARNDGARPAYRVSVSGDAAEREARSLAANVLLPGRPIRPRERPAALVQRQDAPAPAAKSPPILWGIDNKTRRFYASVALPGRPIAEVASYLYGSPDAATALRATNGRLADQLPPGTVLLPSGDPLSAGARQALQAALDSGTILRSEGVPPSESGDLVMYRFSAAGRDFELTGAQFQAMLRGLAVYLTRKATYFKGLAEVGLDVQRDHIQNTNSVIRNLLEWEANVSPPAESLWQTPINEADALVAELGAAEPTADRVAANAQRLRRIAEGYADAHARWYNYIEGTIAAGEVTVTVLSVVRDTSFVIAAGIAGVLAAPIVIPATGVTLATGAAAIGVGALAGAGTYGGLEAVSSAGGQEIADLTSPAKSVGVNWNEVWQRTRSGLGKGAVAGGLGAAGALAAPGVSAAIAGRGFGLTAEGLAAAGTGTRATVGLLTGLTIGVPSGAVDAAITSLPDLASGRLSTGQYLERIGWSALAGGAFGAACGALGGALAKPQAPGEAIVRAGGAPSPAGPATPDFVADPPRVNPATGEVTQTATHLASGERLTLTFDPTTGRLTLTRLATGEVLVLQPGTAAPALPPATTTVGSADIVPPEIVPQGDLVPAPGQGGGGPVITPPPAPTRQLGPGFPTTYSLQSGIPGKPNLRNLPQPRKWQAGEQYIRELYGGGAQQHYPVPVQQGQFPVTRPGGRFVDVPTPTPRGGTLAIEVKTYNRWRTVAGAAQMREVPLTDKISEQISKDVALRAADPNFDPRWAFLDAPPSQGLRDRLNQANITFIIYH